MIISNVQFIRPAGNVCRGKGESSSTLGIRSGSFLLALLAAILAVGGLVAASPAPGAGILALPPPDFTLDVSVSQSDRTVTYTIQFENVGDGLAEVVILRDVLPPGSTYLGDPADLVDGVWTRQYEDLPPGSYVALVPIELPEGVQDGDSVVNLVELEYQGYGAPVTTKTYEHEFRAVLPASPTVRIPTWVVAAPVAVAGMALAGFAVYRYHQRPRFEQVFLMHNSGMLIHHWAADASPSRDIDILSGMFVILRDFVRDSFRDKGGLTELQFGDSRMFLAEGSHTIIAAVVRGNHTNGLPNQIQAAVRDFERRYGSELSDWSGAIERLPDAKSIVDRLLRGRYARGRAS